MTPSAEDQLLFLQRVQRILEEGVFTASYKYALLLSLADLAVEKGDDSGDALPISLDDVAEKLIRYYWRQARPYPLTVGGAAEVLRQNTGGQAAIVTFVSHHAHATVAEVMRDGAVWTSLLARTRRTIVDQPLWKLQRVGDEVLDFLYPHTLEAGRITLRPGVAFCLRRFHALVYDLVTAAWLRFVRELRPNQQLLGQTSDLAEFFFGTERASLDGYRPILAAAQRGACFYCERRLEGPSDVDHFVPWSRYSVDLAHNFVLAHPSCNNRKRDRLAALPHLERWVRRNVAGRGELEPRFERARLAHDLGASVCVTRWAYGQASAAGSLVWQRADELVPLPEDWERAFRWAAT